MDKPSSLGLYLSLGVLASALLAAGLFMMKSRSSVLPPARGSGMFRTILIWIRDPIWIGGLGVQTVGYALYVAALSDAPVSLVAVMMQGGIALFVIFATVFLHERASAREWAGIIGILVAMVVLGVSLTGGAAGGEAETQALWAFSAISVAVTAVPFMFVRLRRNGMATAIASGVAFGLGSLYTKPLADTFVIHTATNPTLRMFAHQWLYLVSATNIAGLILLQNSFHAARGIITMPLSSAISNVVPILGGMAAFAEALPAEPFAAFLRIAAFVLTIGSSALLAVGEEAPARNPGS
jgi:drug/metabolite transporter (DMT)-like permease